MSKRIRIGVACPITSERAAFIEWLDAAGYDPFPTLDLSSIVTVMNARSVEMLIVDTALVSAAELPQLLKRLGPNRPLLLIGETGTEPDGVATFANWLDRPVTREALLLSVELALAEGRPARRSPRKEIAPLASTVDGVSAHVLDVSAEGVRLELSGAQSTALPPLFTMRIPMFGVVTTVKRVWVTQQGPRSVLCGGTVIRTSPRAASAWEQLVDSAPRTGTATAQTES